MAEVNEKVLNGEGLAALWELIKAEDANVLAAGMKLVTGTYAGGSGDGVTVNIGFKPEFVVVMRFNDGSNTGELSGVIAIKDGELSLYRNSTYSSGTRNTTFTNTGFTVAGGSSDRYGLNYTGTTYGYVAFG